MSAADRLRGSGSYEMPAGPRCQLGQDEGPSAGSRLDECPIVVGAGSAACCSAAELVQETNAAASSATPALRVPDERTRVSPIT